MSRRCQAITLRSIAAFGTRLAQRTDEAFVGRAGELEELRRFLDQSSNASVLLVHGPGGIGKTELVRRAAESAIESGYELHWIDGRELAPTPDFLDDAIAPARRAAKPLVVIDSFERIAALDGHLRDALLPGLPEASRVIVVGRQPPALGWQEGGWTAATRERRVEPLSEHSARELLRLLADIDEDTVTGIARWAEGSPLALTLAASAAGEPTFDLSRDLERRELLEPLVRRLVGAEASASHRATLATAAIARQTTLPMLAALLSDADAEAELEWLASRSFVEPLGEGVTPHVLVAKALRADLRLREPLLERELRRSIADHLYERATATGSMLLSIDLAHLAESPVLRWGFSWDAASRYRLDDPRPGDAEEIANALGPEGVRFEGPTRFLAEAPEHVAICRDGTDRLRGFAVAMTPGSAPPFAADDPVLGPWLEHARRNAHGGEAIVWRSNVDVADDLGSGVVALLGMATVLRTASGNPRYGYLPIRAGHPATDFAAAAGAEHLRDLDVTIDDDVLECHVIDWGEGGLLAAQREVVYRELGLEPPPRPRERGEASFDAVRQALRDLHDPRALATSELARGGETDERAASARAALEDAIDRAFGDDPGDDVLREVLVARYLDREPDPESTAERLHISRSSYFRRLREAVGRVAEELAGSARER